MQVKSFRATTIGLALDQVKKDLGPNAIILGNKKVAVSPSESYIEVMAATEPEAPPVSTPKAAEEKGTQIESDLREIKSFLSLLISSKDYFAQVRMQEPLAEIYHSLLAKGLDEKHTYILLRKALSRLDGSSATTAQIVDAFFHEMLEKVKFSRPFHNLSPTHLSPHIFTFLGPTGVGKTTTLAKVAAYLKIKRQLRVGLISVDTYRIGAVDQLQTYANILNLPLIVAQSKEDLRQAIGRLHHEDVVLIDSIGKNYLNRHHIDDLKKIFDGCENMEHLLVLSATAKDADMKQTIIHFRPMQIHSLIFSKVDETLSHGGIINQLIHFPYPVSYFGTGQRVPEDIELATHKRLLAFLFPNGTDSNGKD